MRFSWSRNWDIALAAMGVVALLADGIFLKEGGVWPGAYALSLVAAAPLAWRSRAPLTALLAVEAGAIACVLTFHASWAAIAIVVVMLFTVALHGDRLRSVVVGAFTAILVVATTVLISSSPDLGITATRLGLVFGSVMLGDTLRSRRELAAARRERADRGARELEERNRKRIADERLQIARELHDTLAHALVAINVRAGVAAHLNPGDAGADALKDIKDGSAQALRDLRATLDLLRERDEAAPKRPVLDMASLPQLFDQARATGLVVNGDVQVNGSAIPATVGQAAFRIVQESLTNVVRHADAAQADVHIGVTNGVLDIQVLDDGHAAAAVHNDGHGLRGMAERATVLGGRVDAGPREAGGWRVHARLPIRTQRS